MYKAFAPYHTAKIMTKTHNQWETFYIVCLASFCCTVHNYLASTLHCRKCYILNVKTNHFGNQAMTYIYKIIACHSTSCGEYVILQDRSRS